LIVPACNEGVHIEQSITSHLHQKYTNLEIIVINDRSTDNTGEVLERLKRDHPRLNVVHVKELPQGWMGKHHALQIGAERASGEFLLFTDGDIFMEKTTIARAVQYIEREGIDHVALLFRNISPGWLLNSLILGSSVGFSLSMRPWRARRDPKCYIGVGAFNLVRKSAYLQVGKHETIKMHPLDDIMIGKLLKKNGFSQECLLATDLVTVPWYSSVSDMINGIMKNILATINYRFLMLLPVLLGIFFFNILPYWGLLLADAPTKLLFGAVAVIRLTAFNIGTRMIGISPWCTLGTIFTPYITIYAIMRAAYCNYRDDGIYWRGTHYPLTMLRKNESPNKPLSL
jgi:glycosyltransferase involved in cell wall biosynthesis